MNKGKYRYLIVFCCFLAVVITSCKQKQKIVYSTTPIVEKDNSELFNDIVQSSISYNSLSSKLNMVVTTGSRSLSSRASLRIVKDDAIQISIQPLFGVEMFRFYIDPDSIVLLDRMNKRYVKESITTLKEQYPIGFDFYTMQSIITNSIFVSGKHNAEISDYKLFKYDQTSDRSHYLNAVDDKSDIEYSFTVNGDDRITFTHLMQHQKMLSLQWSYSNFARINNATLFPLKMSALITSKSRKIDTELHFSDVVVDDAISLSINVPSGYNRTSIAEIFKIITSIK